MRAHVGDWLVVEGRTAEQHRRQGLITEVHSDDGSPPYAVHWLDDDHQALVYPGPDAVVMTADELAEHDQGVAARIQTLQATISGSPRE